MFVFFGFITTLGYGILYIIYGMRFEQYSRHVKLENNTALYIHEKMPNFKFKSL